MTTSTPTPFRLLRKQDLVDLGFAFPGLRLDAPLLGPRVLVRADPAVEGYLVVEFGPQHVVERAFFEFAGDRLRPTDGDGRLDGDEPRPPPPVPSRISGRSVLVFVVGATDEIPYSEAGLLAAMRTLPLRVVDAAVEPAAPTGFRLAAPRGHNVAVMARLLRAAAELTAGQGVHAAVAAGLLVPSSPELTGALPGTAPAGTALPENPLADVEHNPRTGVELPYRLLLSPPRTATWVHDTDLTTGADDGRVELWHTRMRAASARAVWTRDAGFDPRRPTPLPRAAEFRMALDQYDRSSVVHLTSNHALPGVTTPKPLDVTTLALSGLGGWLDSLGRWQDPPGDLNVTEWRHRAALGRDHYVRVMYSGRLFPFGHRAELVKVTERKFDHTRPDGAAYLSQRMYVLVREPVLGYGTPVASDESPPRQLHLLFPFRSVRLVTQATPDLAPPRNITGIPDTRFAFFPATADEDPFRFKVSAVDLDGHAVEFTTPLAFLEKPVHESPDDLRTVIAQYERLDATPASDAPVGDATAELRGQALAFAAGAKPDDTTLTVTRLVWGAATNAALLDPAPGPDRPRFVPTLRWAQAVVPAVKQLSPGGDASVPVRYPDPYAVNGFSAANKGELFVELVEPVAMDFGGNGDQSGGLVKPSFSVAGLSRLTGPVAETRQPAGVDAGGFDKWAKLAEGTFSPLDYFGGVDGARLFGLIPLHELLHEVGLDKLKAPNFFASTVNAVTGFLGDLGRLRGLLDGVEQAFAEIADLVIRLTDAAAIAVELVRDFIAGQFEDDPDAPDMDEVENGFTAFSAALTALRDRLPAAVDPGVRTLLTRVQEQVATWTTAVGRVLALKDAIALVASGGALPDVNNAHLEWTPQVKPWKPGGDAPRDKADAIFWPDPEHGRLALVVDRRGSLRPDVPQAVDISCSLERFELLLVPGFQVLQLNFRHIRFRLPAGRKPDIDVKFDGVDFINELSFVQTLRNLIPLDGFSDPPAIDVSARGITASFAITLPNVAVGVFSLENLGLNADLDLPFIGGSLQVGFAFCRREAPFRLTVSALGGGGYFGIVLTPTSIAVLEAALEFGAAVSMDFGVASGSLSVMAGIYFRLDVGSGDVTLLGYLRARGEVDVLGIVSASIELYLELGYEDGYAVGRATLTISIEIGFFEESVEISCEKRFAGSGTDAARALAGEAGPVSPPTFADLMSPYPDPATGARRDPVFEYCTAFAEVG